MATGLAKKDKPVARALCIDANGEVAGDRPLSAPAIRVKVVKSIGGDSGDAEGFEPYVEFLAPGEAEPRAVAGPNGNDGWFPKQFQAWDAAREMAARAVHAAETGALDRDDVEATTALRRFRAILMDRCIVERATIKGQKSVEYAPFSGADLLLALKLLARYFGAIDSQVIIGFRKRVSSDGNAWTRGKSDDGAPRLLPGKAEKLGSEKPGLMRGVLGYAPQVMITVCGVQWAAMDDRKKECLLHDLLSRVRYDAEKKSIYIVEPVGMFADTAREFADVKPAAVLELTQAVIEGLIDHGEQLELVGLTLEADATKTENAKVAPARGKKALAANGTH